MERATLARTMQKENGDPQIFGTRIVLIIALPLTA
jgi:hypothetical protein